MKRKLVILMFLFFYLSACTKGPNFVPPSAPKVPLAKPTEIKSIGSQTIQVDKKYDPQWWHELHSPQLNHLVQEGLRHNYTIRSKREALKAAMEQIKAAKGMLYPHFYLTASNGRRKYGVEFLGNSGLDIPTYTFYTFGPRLNWSLDVFGKTRRTIEYQYAYAAFQNQEYHAAELALSGNIVMAALSMASFRSQIAITKQLIHEDQKNCLLVKNAFIIGFTTRMDVLSAESQLDRDKALLPPLQQKYQLAKNELATLLGQFPTNWQVPTIDFTDFNLPKQLPLSLPSDLIHDRPDILAAEAMLHAASANIGIAEANLYPQIVVTGVSLQEALGFLSLFNGDMNAGNILLSMAQPLFTGGILRAQRRAAIDLWKAAYNDYQQVVVSAFAQVNTILHALRHDEQEIRRQQTTLKTTKESLRLARLSYNEGNADLLKILDAQRIYNQASIHLVEAQTKQYQDTIQLYLSLGGHCCRC